MNQYNDDDETENRNRVLKAESIVKFLEGYWHDLYADEVDFVEGIGRTVSVKQLNELKRIKARVIA